MMGYSATSRAVPLLFSTTSMVLNLAWSATSFLLPTTSTPSRRSRTSSNYSKQRDPASNRPSTILPPAQMELRLSTCCSSCGSKVSLEVPKWISDSLDAAKNGNQCDGSCQHGRNDGPSAGEIRGVVVEGAVSLAYAVRNSPVLPVIYAAFKAFFAFLIYLDARFLLRQRGAQAAGEIATGLVEIEKELGLMRNAGEGLSIGWEALVKGVIAFAKSDSSPPRTSRPEFVPSSQSYSYNRVDPFEQSTYSGEPVSPTYDTPQRYLHPSDTVYYREEPRLSTDMDDGSATLTPTTPIDTRPNSPYAPPPLRRVPLSSPVLRTSYLSSGSSTPSQYFHEARPAPHPSSDYQQRLPSYSSSYSDEPESFARRRTRSGPDSSSSSTNDSIASGGGWPARTVLGWADKLLTKADTLQRR